MKKVVIIILAIIAILISAIILLNYLGYFSIWECNSGSFAFSEDPQSIGKKCYRDLGKDTKSLSICNRAKDSMRESCIRGIAIGERSIEVCNNLEGEIKSACQIDVIFEKRYFKELSSSDSEICESMSNFKDDCYIELSIELLDISYCEKIDFPTEKNKCYMRIAESNSDSSICENIISDPELRDTKAYCYSKF